MRYWFQIRWYSWAITELFWTAASLWCCLLLPSRCVQGTPFSAGNHITESVTHTCTNTAVCRICVFVPRALWFSRQLFSVCPSADCWFPPLTEEWTWNTYTPEWWCHTCLILMYDIKKHFGNWMFMSFVMSLWCHVLYQWNLSRLSWRLTCVRLPRRAVCCRAATWSQCELA